MSGMNRLTLSILRKENDSEVNSFPWNEKIKVHFIIIHYDRL